MSTDGKCVYYPYCGNKAPKGRRRYNNECDSCLDALRDHCTPGEWANRDAFMADFYGKPVVNRERRERASVDPRQTVLSSIDSRYRYVLWCSRCGDDDRYIRNSKTVRAARERRESCSCGGRYELIRDDPPSYVTV